ncbi:DUF3102 domain-containing protein [Bradyrhizobium sp. 200]|uniref:DUF3102 domain-containing protein n=1 Tax=Bradyrhizobium sp. 200 TaxID=2782665 RepID=UPI001FFE6802|nr:DUF3102 domain-containing protein [Bradyrhizobium sp. 200]UPJ49904.1 DUF3102 domain-containing protein [Bradyrhizobium sp. 200]
MTTNNELLADITGRIRSAEKQSVANIVEIGRLLELAKEALEHGAFLPWLQSEFAWSERSALNYRRVFHFAEALKKGKFGRKRDIATLDLTLSALYDLADLANDAVAMPDIFRDEVLALIKLALKTRVSRSVASNFLKEYRRKKDEKEHTESEEDRDDEGDKDDSEGDDDGDTDEEGESGDGDKDDGTPEAAIRSGVRTLADRTNLVTQWHEALKDFDPAKLRDVIVSLQAVLQKIEVKSAAKSAADRAESRTKRLFH